MMKKILCLLTFLLSMSAISQDATSKGKYFFEAGTSSFGENTIKHGNSTAFNVFSSDGTTVFSLGFEGGSFIVDNTAIKFGLGYTDLDFSTFLTYKFGFKHYAGGNVPIQVDITGSVPENQGLVDTPDPLWLGLQLGYAVFLSDDIAFEPTFRYNASLNKDYTEDGIVELRFNFVVFF